MSTYSIQRVVRLQNSRIFCERGQPSICQRKAVWSECENGGEEWGETPHAPACEARALHKRGSRIRRFAPSENVRKRLFCHSRPQSHDPFDLRQGSRALPGPDFLSMRRVFVSYSQPIRFATFDGKSVNRGLPVLDKARALDPCRRSE